MREGASACLPWIRRSTTRLVPAFESGKEFGGRHPETERKATDHIKTWAASPSAWPWHLAEAAQGLHPHRRARSRSTPGQRTLLRVDLGRRRDVGNVFDLLKGLSLPQRGPWSDLRATDGRSREIAAVLGVGVATGNGILTSGDTQNRPLMDT